MKRTELLQKWLELKEQETKAKEARVALEEQIWNEFESEAIKAGKMSGSVTENNYKVTIKINAKLKVTDESLVPSGVDIYKTVVDEKKLIEFENEPWVECVYNKPTFTVVKTK